MTHLDNRDLLGGDRLEKFFDGKPIRGTGMLQGLDPDGARTFRVMVAELDDFEVARIK